MTKKNDWPKTIYQTPKSEYIHTDISLAALAMKWWGVQGCSYSMITKHSADEGWADLRKEYRHKVEMKTIEKHSESEAEMRARHIAGLQAIQCKALEVIEDESKPFKDVQGAEAAYANALKLEQQIREGGLPDDRPQVVIKVINGRGNGNGKT